MPKILLFNYYWPPSGGPAVQRWLSLATLLSREGFELIVITVDEKYASYTSLDESLNERVPKELRVIKTKSFEVLHLYQKFISGGHLPTAGFANESHPSSLQRLARWIRGNFFFPDPRKGWNTYALDAARPLIESEDIRGIITAGPPQSTHLIGAQLKREYDLFWLCDFHDAWTNVWYYDELMRTRLVRKIDLSMERSVLNQCDHIITVGRQILQDFATKTGKPDKMNIHSMGYDEELFNDVVPANDFSITYTGTMASNYEPRAFFDAVKNVQETHPEWSIHLNIAGLISDDILDMVNELGLGTCTTVHGYLPHQQAVKILKASTLLLLVSPNTPGSEMIIPGKIYEYMASRVPILNLSTKHSETAEIISECGAGETFERPEVNGIQEFIERTYKRWLADPSALYNTNTGFKKYARQTEARSLAKLLRERLAH